MELLKVSSNSNPRALAGALTKIMKENSAVDIQAVGAGALNQAIKAIAIARGYISSRGVDLVCAPGFVDIEIDGEKRTAIKLSVEVRS